MMKHNLTLYKNISRNCTVCLAYILAFLTAITVYEKQIVAPYYLIGIPIILIAYLLIERYCFHPLFYFLLHGIVLIPILCISYPSTCYKILYIVLFVCEFSHACYIWRAGSDPVYNELPWFLFLVVVILYTGGRILHQDVFSNYVYIIGLALILLHFIRYFIYGLTQMFQESEHTTSMPTKKIMLTNASLLGILLLSFLIFGLFIQVLHLDHFLFVAGDALLKILQVIIRFFLYIAALVRILLSSDAKDAEPTSEEEALQEAVHQIPPTPVWAEILTILIEIGLILFALYIVYRIIRAAISALLTRYTSDSDIVITLQDKVENVEQRHTGPSLMQRIKEQLNSSYRAKIRRFYRIKIRQSKKLILHASDTPSDIACQMQKVYDENIDALTEIYEKARYSDSEITIEDAQKGGIL